MSPSLATSPVVLRTQEVEGDLDVFHSVRDVPWINIEAAMWWFYTASTGTEDGGPGSQSDLAEHEIGLGWTNSQAWLEISRAHSQAEGWDLTRLGAAARIGLGCLVATRPPFSDCVLYFRDTQAEAWDSKDEKPPEERPSMWWQCYHIRTNEANHVATCLDFTIQFFQQDDFVFFDAEEALMDMMWDERWMLRHEGVGRPLRVPPGMLVALAFLNQPTIKSVESQALSRPIRRRLSRAGQWVGPARHRTLVIDAPQEALRDRQATSDGCMPLHPVRGHWATYDERPLFGKLRGTFWVPPHERGNAAFGVVSHDYRIGDSIAQSRVEEGLLQPTSEASDHE